MTDRKTAVDADDDDRIHEDDERALTADELKQLRKKLIEERAGVQERLLRHVQEAVDDNDNLPDEMDIAARQTDQAYLFRLADKEKKLLTEIDHALAKFERGIFGLCEGTGEPIGYKRLELRPWTRFSLEYKERLEREKGGRAKRA
jgi:DnaK suppressor protein